jgi:hypothetical protein
VQSAQYKSGEKSVKIWKIILPQKNKTSILLPQGRRYGGFLIIGSDWGGGQ